MIEYTKDELNIMLEWYKKRIEFLLNSSWIVNTVNPDDNTKYIHRKYIKCDTFNKMTNRIEVRIAITINDLINQFMKDSHELNMVFPSEAIDYNSYCIDLKESDNKDYIIIECFLFNT